LTQAREVHDPIAGFRRRVLASGELTASELDSIDRLAAGEMDAVVTAAHAGSAPPLEALYTDVYSTY
jgi:TPP-dependent pyruvate/acetoin dehydrogenase alpha subunit